MTAVKRAMMLEKRMKPMGRLTSLVVRSIFVISIYLGITSTIVVQPGSQVLGTLSLVILEITSPDNVIWPDPTNNVCVFLEG